VSFVTLSGEELRERGGLRATIPDCAIEAKTNQ